MNKNTKDNQVNIHSLIDLNLFARKPPTQVFSKSSQIFYIVMALKTISRLIDSADKQRETILKLIKLNQTREVKIMVGDKLEVFNGLSIVINSLQSIIDSSVKFTVTIKTKDPQLQSNYGLLEPAVKVLTESLDIACLYYKIFGGRSNLTAYLKQGDTNFIQFQIPMNAYQRDLYRRTERITSHLLSSALRVIDITHLGDSPILLQIKRILAIWKGPKKFFSLQITRMNSRNTTLLNCIMIDIPVTFILDLSKTKYSLSQYALIACGRATCTLQGGNISTEHLGDYRETYIKAIVTHAIRHSLFNYIQIFLAAQGNGYELKSLNSIIEKEKAAWKETKLERKAN